MLFPTDDRGLFQRFVPITNTFDLEPLKPHLDKFELETLPRFLGLDVLEQIQGFAQALPETPLSVEDRSAYLAMAATAKLAMADYLPFAELMIGNDGITIPAGDNRKAAFEYQTKRIQAKLLEDGWMHVNDLVGLVAKNPDVFPSWPDTPYALELEEAIFKTALDFSDYYPISNRWLTFIALMPFMRQIEERRGTDAYERLQERYPELASGPGKKAFRALKRALAYETVLTAIPFLSVELNGINVQVNYASTFGNTDLFKAPDEKQMNFVIMNLGKQVELAWEDFDKQTAPPTPPPRPDADVPQGAPFGLNGFVIL